MAYLGTANGDLPIVNPAAAAADGVYYGLDGDDGLVVTNRSAVMYGGNGNDALWQLGSGYLDAFGDYGNDWILATSSNGSSYIYGGPGDDIVQTGSGFDYIEGGQGRDALYGGSSPDIIYGGDGDDKGIVTAGASTAGYNTTVQGGLYGEGGDDYLDGGRGDDFLQGGDGADILVGGFGDDQLYGNSGADWIFGDDGSDVIWAGSENDVALGGGGVDYIYGEGGNDNLSGLDGNDYLAGGTGNDYMVGGNGNDTLVAGDDGAFKVMYGGLGNDVFYCGNSIDYIHTDYLETNGWEQVYNFADGQDIFTIPRACLGNVYLNDTKGYAQIQIYNASGSHWIDFYGITSAQLADQIIYI